MFALRRRGTTALLGSRAQLGWKRASGIRHKSSTSGPGPSSTQVTSQDLQILQQELKALQQLIKEQRSQSYHIESLTRTVSAQNAQLEERLQSIESNVSKIGTVEQIAVNLRDFLNSNPAIRRVLENLEAVVNRGTPFVKQHKNAVLGALAAIALLWNYRSIYYQSASEEVADLARRTLEQESLRKSIQETLETVANNPQTLQTLTLLVQELINHEQTQKDLVDLVVRTVDTQEVQKALMDLMEVVFKDPYLQKLTGEFLLKGLDEEEVKAMLDAQTADLVRDTVEDSSVQKATAVGVKQTLWYTMTPPFLWRFIPGGKKKDAPPTIKSEATAKSADEQGDKGSSRSEDHEDTESTQSSLPSQ